ncbi:phage distal tail protein [Umezawaea beigongshangensis]|uniref:phage distal tail protein n=1 Tax=Umezawaea beigongshangensis TaxID=2780383 RepID=UPI0018F2162E|nr:hypothetical protein [Umezawaea beigongshangensis]
MAAGDLITADDQLEWRGVLLGNDTRFGKVALEGWLDQPDTRDGDVALDNEHGAQAGQLLLDRRVVTLTLTIAGPAGFYDAVNLLRRITTLDENPEEEPLVVRSAGITGMVWARCVGRIIPENLDYSIGLTQCVVRWRASNPRILRLPQLAPEITPPVPSSGGLPFPLRFPLRFGGTPAGGELVLTNAGPAHAQPTWRITGPCPAPRITNADTGRRLWFDDDYTLPAGQVLDVSTADKTVLLVQSGVSRSSALVRREWFTLPPGVTRVRFDSADGTGYLTALYHHTDL